MYLVVGRSLVISSFVSAVKKDVLENKKDFYHRGGGRGGQRNHIRTRLCYLRSEAQELSLRPCPTCNHHGGSDFFIWHCIMLPSSCFSIFLYHFNALIIIH